MLELLSIRVAEGRELLSLYGLLCVSFVNVYQFVCALLSFLDLWWDMRFDCISSRSTIFITFLILNVQIIFALSQFHNLHLNKTSSLLGKA